MSQKRSPNTYQKINTIFKRDINNIIMPYDGFVDPVFEFLKDCKFRATEKIDGTNIRIEILPNITEEGVEFNLYYKGKTDKAQMNNDLLAYLKDKFPEEKVFSVFNIKKFIPREEWAEYGWVEDEDIPKNFDIYGEGYGTGIQAAGKFYRKDKAFIMFDVRVGNTYLLPSVVEDIASQLGIQVVPLIGYMTIKEAIEYAKKGFNSHIAETEFPAEGLVLTTDSGIRTHRGDRIIFKIKSCDFNKYYEKYKTYDPVEQIPNKELETTE